MARASLFLAVAVSAALLLLPLAAAQSLDPAREKAERDAAELQADPAAFAQSRASQEGVEREAEWTRDYACDTVEDTAETVGLPEPELSICPDEPDVSAAPPEPEEPVGEVEELEEGVVELLDDAVGTVEEIVEDPANAVDAVLDFLGAVVEFAEELIGGLVALLAAPAMAIFLLADLLVSTAGSVVDLLASSAVASFDVTVEAGSSLAGGSVEAVAGATQASAALVSSVVGGVGDAADHLGDAASDAADAVADSVGAIGDWLGQLVGGSDPQAPAAPSDVPVEETALPTDAVGDLLDTVTEAAN